MLSSSMLCFKEKQDRSTLYCLVLPASRSVNSMPLARSTGWKKQVNAECGSRGDLESHN